MQTREGHIFLMKTNMDRDTILRRFGTNKNCFFPVRILPSVFRLFSRREAGQRDARAVLGWLSLIFCYNALSQYFTVRDPWLNPNSKAHINSTIVKICGHLVKCTAPEQNNNGAVHCSIAECDVRVSLPRRCTSPHK